MDLIKARNTGSETGIKHVGTVRFKVESRLWLVLRFRYGIA